MRDLVRLRIFVIVVVKHSGRLVGWFVYFQNDFLHKEVCLKYPLVAWHTGLLTPEVIRRAGMLEHDPYLALLTCGLQGHANSQI